MPQQTHKQPSSHERSAESSEMVRGVPHKSGTDLKAEMDALLDEIDDVLVENAEEFVNTYIQKGGE